MPLRFHCQKTGKCCQTPSLFIPVTHRDLVYLYRELDEEFDQLIDFLAFYSISTQPARNLHAYKKIVVPPISTSRGLGFLAVKKHAETQACVFLLKNNRCSIYDSRPLSCLLYPITFVRMDMLKGDLQWTRNCEDNEKEVCLRSIELNDHVHAVFSKASINTCLGVGKGALLSTSRLTRMAQTFYRDLNEFVEVVSEINRLADKGELLSPREVISVLLAYGLKKIDESSRFIQFASSSR